MRYLLGRLACLLEFHDWQTVSPHWKHQCFLTHQKCRRCGAIR